MKAAPKVQKAVKPAAKPPAKPPKKLPNPYNRGTGGRMYNGSGSVS